MELHSEVAVYIASLIMSKCKEAGDFPPRVDRECISCRVADAGIVLDVSVNHTDMVSPTVF